MTKRRILKKDLIKICFIFGFAAAFTFFALKIPKETEAASLNRFDPGNIISDYTMSNVNTMSVADIDRFLHEKGNCNNTNTYLASSYPHLSYHIENGHFVCLADEHFGDGTNIGSGQSAAQIIYDVAHEYSINPQVLIVLLQKEQGLITDSWPNNIQYRSATGYGCPDTAACDSKYYGFKNQLKNAADLFRTVLNGGWTNYPLGVNYIYYNPDRNCGGSNVEIKNLATSSLYRYTPYQPNAGALAAGYGTATCGAYGNRNFYLYFMDWFGDPTWDGWPELSIVLSNNRVAKVESEPNLTYKTHIQHYGWLSEVGGGEMSGTAGYSARVEAISMKLEENDLNGGIEYRTHVQKQGWEESYKKDGETSGSVGQSLRVEAIQIRLTGEVAKLYDVYYRTHVQTIGWTDWSKNDEISGTTGQSLRIEAIQVKLVRKYGATGPEYSTHIQTIGWADLAANGAMAGTTGQSKRMEAITINLPTGLAGQGDVIYRTHVQTNGWMDWAKNGEIAGTTGQSKRMEAVEIKLSGELEKKYDIYYRTHVQTNGWMGWKKNGETSGTTGQSLRVEAIEIQLVAK